jgi:AcrR family transcriptional regulator
MPKIVDYEARRREIADKAVSVMVRDGIQETSLGKVADLCGLGRTTLYQYFSNIDEVVVFTLEDVFGRLDRETAAVYDDPRLGATDKLLRLMEFLERVAVLDKPKMILVLDFLLHPNRKAPQIDFDVQEHVRRLRAGLEQLLVMGIESGELKPMNPLSMAFTLFSFIEAATVHSALYDNISLESTLSDIRLLIDGLKA